MFVSTYSVVKVGIGGWGGNTILDRRSWVYLIILVNCGLSCCVNIGMLMVGDEMTEERACVMRTIAIAI